MEHLRVANSAVLFDRAVHGGLDGETIPVLPDGGDLAVFVKPNATVGGRPGVVVTFTVRLPDGTMARAQSVTTLANFENVFAAIRGWKDGGHL